MEIGVNAHSAWELKSDSDRVQDLFNGEKTNVSGGEFARFSTEG